MSKQDQNHQATEGTEFTEKKQEGFAIRLAFRG
jgi:hypothetical protein